ncbi:MAG TPA: FAD-binding protein, partial [Silvibacterium sp.]|nr:FAD-binding protein [Silvibacterium sp.]
MAIATDTDFLIVGAGIAGLRAAIELSETGRVLVVTKE